MAAAHPAQAQAQIGGVGAGAGAKWGGRRAHDFTPAERDTQPKNFAPAKSKCKPKILRPPRVNVSQKFCVRQE